jgi:NAD(P)-dependent dehydrogenase (short-subunit alcohol dehydrogenase family)
MSSGLGRIMTERLLERGDRVAATLRKVHVFDELKSKYGDLLWVAALGVRDTAAVRNVVDRAFSDLGRIDVIVNNAGCGLFGASEAQREIALSADLWV